MKDKVIVMPAMPQQSMKVKPLTPAKNPKWDQGNRAGLFWRECKSALHKEKGRIVEMDWPLRANPELVSRAFKGFETLS
jgi:hypothetical protein